MRVENIVGNLVRRYARVLRQVDHGQARNHGRLQGVVQLVAHVEAAVGQLADAAGDKGVGALIDPAAVVDHGRFGCDHAGVDDAEHAAALEVGLDDARDLGWRDRFVGKGGHGDRDLVAAHAGDFKAQLGLGCGADQQAGAQEQVFDRVHGKSFKRNSGSIVRSTLPSRFFGNGDEALIAFSTARSYSGTPLLLIFLTEIISPVGNCSMR